MKIRWDRIGTLAIFVVSSILVLHDIYYILIKPMFSNTTYGWTYFGFITFIIAICISVNSFESIKEWWDK